MTTRKSIYDVAGEMAGTMDHLVVKVFAVGFYVEAKPVATYNIISWSDYEKLINGSPVKGCTLRIFTSYGSECDATCAEAILKYWDAQRAAWREYVLNLSSDALTTMVRFLYPTSKSLIVSYKHLLLDRRQQLLSDWIQSHRMPTNAAWVIMGLPQLNFECVRDSFK